VKELALKQVQVMSFHGHTKQQFWTRYVEENLISLTEADKWPVMML
jgi:hypothetical protein